MASVPRFIVIHAHGRGITTFSSCFTLCFCQSFSVPKKFLDGSASLGGGRRFLRAFCESGKDPREVSEASKGKMLACLGHHLVLLGSGARRQRFPALWKLPYKAQQEPLLRTSIPVSYTHKHPLPGGMTLAHPWPLDHAFVTQLLQFFLRHAISQAKNTLVGTKHSILLLSNMVFP